MKKVLITGIGGFVGYHLVNYLKEQKKLIDIQLTNLKNSLKENNPEDVIKYISN